MPTFTPILPDPTEIIVAGAQMRVQPTPLKFPDVPEYLEGRWSPLIVDPPDRLPLTPFSLVWDPINFGMTDVCTPQFLSTRQPDQAVNAGIGVNSCICTPCGAIVPVLLGHQWFVNDIGQTTVRFQLTGVTKDSAGAALGGCRVVVLETGRVQGDGAPVVAETISDGSGNYSVIVPMNVAYQAIAYKPGSPDVAGITRNDLIPVSA